MVFKEDIITDTAWKHLHERLKQDGLLPEKDASESRLPEKGASLKRAAVITVLLIGAYAATYMLRHKNTGGKDRQVIHNGANAPTLATVLNDGSIVYLSEQTSLTCPGLFAADKREVALQGEAFFDIQRNAGQPFFIDTDVATVEVTGTSFHVKSKDRTSFILSVRDGEVRVFLKNRRRSLSVQAGETVSFDSGQLQWSKTNANRFGEYFKRIHFKDERLDHVARIINRTSDSLHVEVAPDVAGRRITFTLSGNNDIEALCLALNLQYRRQDRMIHISKEE
jgi:ferric-dicitrate binding protein FerR (iron transport regulator)